MYYYNRCVTEKEIKKTLCFMLRLVTGITKKLTMDGITQTEKFRLSAIKFAKKPGDSELAAKQFIVDKNSTTERRFSPKAQWLCFYFFHNFSNISLTTQQIFWSSSDS